MPKLDVLGVIGDYNSPDVEPVYGTYKMCPCCGEREYNDFAEQCELCGWPDADADPDQLELTL
jgi:uncharacterized protein (DUF983 family)